MEYAVLNRCVSSCDLKCRNKSLFLSCDGNGFQRQGAEQLNALLPVVVRRAAGTEEEEEDNLREREEVGMWRRSDRYGGTKL